MAQQSTAELIAILRITLHSVEVSTWKNSPSVQEMKRAMLRAIVEMESEGGMPLRPYLLPKREGAQVQRTS